MALYWAPGSCTALLHTPLETTPPKTNVIPVSTLVQKLVNQVCLECPKATDEHGNGSSPHLRLCDGGENMLPWSVLSRQGTGGKLARTESLGDTRLCAGGLPHIPNAQTHRHNLGKQTKPHTTHTRNHNRRQQLCLKGWDSAKSFRPAHFTSFRSHFLWPHCRGHGDGSRNMGAGFRPNKRKLLRCSKLNCSGPESGRKRQGSQPVTSWGPAHNPNVVEP